MFLRNLATDWVELEMRMTLNFFRLNILEKWILFHKRSILGADVKGTVNKIIQSIMYIELQEHLPIDEISWYQKKYMHGKKNKASDYKIV